jgi:hypothetical protein
MQEREGTGCAGRQAGSQNHPLTAARQRQPPQESIQLYDNDPEPPPSERRREESPCLSHSGWLAKKQLLICISPRPLPRSTCSAAATRASRARQLPRIDCDNMRESEREREREKRRWTKAIYRPAGAAAPSRALPLTPGLPQAVAWPPAFSFIHEGACLHACDLA